MLTETLPTKRNQQEKTQPLTDLTGLNLRRFYARRVDCVWWWFSHHILWHRPVMSLLIFVTWCFARGRRGWVKFTSVRSRQFSTAFLTIMLHRSSQRCSKCLKTWVCGKNFANPPQKKNTWQSLGFQFWLLLLRINTYSIMLSKWRHLLLRRTQQFLAP